MWRILTISLLFLPVAGGSIEKNPYTRCELIDQRGLGFMWGGGGEKERFGKIVHFRIAWA